jgi:hypothetical protein
VAATAANSGLETAVESNGVGVDVGVGVPARANTTTRADRREATTTGSVREG